MSDPVIIASFTKAHPAHMHGVAAVQTLVEGAVVNGARLIRVLVHHVYHDGRSVLVGKRVLSVSDAAQVSQLAQRPLDELRPVATDEPQLLAPYDGTGGAAWINSPSCAVTWWLRLHVLLVAAELRKVRG